MPSLFYSLLGALIMLAFGLVDMIVMSRLVYPALRERYEAARLHGKKAVSPRLVMTVTKIASFIVLPVIGFVIGGRVLPALMG